jgi:hypothetical protein
VVITAKRRTATLRHAFPFNGPGVTGQSSGSTDTLPALVLEHKHVYFAPTVGEGDKVTRLLVVVSGSSGLACQGADRFAWLTKGGGALR